MPDDVDSLVKQFESLYLPSRSSTLPEHFKSLSDKEIAAMLDNVLEKVQSCELKCGP
jgi:hypothetical protein